MHVYAVRVLGQVCLAAVFITDTAAALEDLATSLKFWLGQRVYSTYVFISAKFPPHTQGFPVTESCCSKRASSAHAFLLEVTHRLGQ